MLIFMPIVFVRGTKMLKRDVLLSFVYGVYKGMYILKAGVWNECCCFLIIIKQNTPLGLFLFSQDKNLIQQSMQSMFVVSKKKKPFMVLLCISISTKEPFTWHICMIVESFLGFF